MPNGDDEKRTAKVDAAQGEPPLVRSLRLLDPILQFLTKATGQTAVPLKTLLATVPAPKTIPSDALTSPSSTTPTTASAQKSDCNRDFGLYSRHAALLNHLVELDEMQILEIVTAKASSTAAVTPENYKAFHEGRTSTKSFLELAKSDEDLSNVRVGFPSPPSAITLSSPSMDQKERNKVAAIKSSGGPRGLHGSTKTAAKRRLTALKRILCRRAQEKTKPPSHQTQAIVDGKPTKRTRDATATPPDSNLIEASNEALEERIRPSHSLNNAGKDWTLMPPSVLKGNGQDVAAEEFSEDNLEDAGMGNVVPSLSFSNEEERAARKALEDLFQFATDTTQPPSPPLKRPCLKHAQARKSTSKENHTKTGSVIPQSILPKQVSYAGSNPAQVSRFGQLSNECLDLIPDFLLEAFHISKDSYRSGEGLSIKSQDVLLTNGQSSPSQSSAKTNQGRRLYIHQVEAIESAMKGNHTLVCTGTGSGKSLCFLLPVLAAAYTHGKTSIILFPTKALAQDQVVKLNTTLSLLNEKLNRNDDGKFCEVNAATLDGDCSHAQRAQVVKHAKIILTNPDTLHAAILPNHKNLYRPLLERVSFVVIDEAHMYEGVFGAHVAMVLSRLARVCAISRHSCADNDVELPGKKSTWASGKTHIGPIYLACSATMPHPEHYFRLLCPISSGYSHVTIVKEDGSPRSSKHFFVWNPPLLDIDGNSTGSVEFKARRKQKQPKQGDETPSNLPTSDRMQEKIRRRHSADETALLLARAVASGVRCIAFCKTRCLVEWVYERAIAALQRDPNTSHLADKVQSYRGGYTRKERRVIEEQLFQNKLLGVVGTSALELGVDIGGLDLTLHCGFPTSHASLLQQAGRAGRGTQRLNIPSLAIVVCFNSPPDQHLWRHPSSLLRLGTSVPTSMPLYSGLVQEHLLCAGHEFPLTGYLRATDIVTTSSHQHDDSMCKSKHSTLCDVDLFGSQDLYNEALETLVGRGSLIPEIVAVAGLPGKSSTIVHKTHPSISKPWLRVSLRSIEPLSYNIVNVAHPGQNGRMDGTIYDDDAVMDVIPYSRVFYHAFPGAIIMHRGQRFKIISLTRPPAFASTGQYNGGNTYRANSLTLAAYAKPSLHGYFTRPLSSLHITVVKQMERVDLTGKTTSKDIDPNDVVTGNGADVARDMTGQASPPIPFTENPSIHDDQTIGSFAGCGVVTIRRNVHGYKKISMVTREELSRSELSLPDMEFDSFAIWLDCDADVLKRFLGPVNFGYGMHALSHALVAVAPLFVPCVISDVQCDHAVYKPTRVTIFDERAGGSGICAQLWHHVFVPNGLVEAAIQLLEKCPSCSGDTGYEGGCPACLQFGECIKFNDYLCKSSGLVIAKHLLQRLKQTSLYKAAFAKKEKGVSTNKKTFDNMNDSELVMSPTSRTSRCSDKSSDNDEELDRENMKEVASPQTPRKKARARALKCAKDIFGARDRQVIVGRPTWPLDESSGVTTLSRKRCLEEA